jgi:uncharacterized UBP type Zn finger protein
MECTHLDRITVKTTDKNECAECVAQDLSWVALRLCLECGHVGCCDSSTGRHATKHATAQKHLMLGSAEPGQKWIWCREDKAYVGELDKAPRD